jgi:glycerol kinase|tara:strand:- start:5153 stop:6670 length:1518 start_codon:yes stop_codon:yes gene_type:complete
MSTYILAIDQGTTSSRALIFDNQGNIVSSAQQEFPQHFPNNGWVEHDPTDIWQTTLNSCIDALSCAKLKADAISCIGITNQRETTIVWDKATGLAITNAIVWQDRRTSDYCAQLKKEGFATLVQEKTGLLIDSYFSATKLRWILENVPGARQRAQQGELAFGTVDSFLLWNLTKGKQHSTDATNASRTMLFNIHTQQWDSELLELFGIPISMLPEVKDCSDDFGKCDASWLGGEIPITGVIGDQQAAAFGQCCFKAGMAKSTYGTGCFVLLNTGEEALQSSNRLLTTVAYRLDGKTTYAIEGSIFMAGATMQWLRDGIGLINDAGESEALARACQDNLSVYLVPAFTGLGAPYWDPDARGALFGMTRDTGAKEIVTAGLMSVCYQTKDLMLAIAADGASLNQLRVDGGMVNNNYLVQALSDVLDCEVHRPKIIETTALGAAYAAGLKSEIFESLAAIEAKWQLDSSFSPAKNEKWRQTNYNGWLDAVARTRSDLFTTKPEPPTEN